MRLPQHERAEPHALLLWKQGVSAPPALVRYLAKTAGKIARRALIIAGVALVVVVVAITALTLVLMSGHGPDLALVLQSIRG